MRKIAEFIKEDGKKTRVYWDEKWGGFVVKFYDKNGVHIGISNYNTGDEHDAIDTARI